MGVVFLIVIVVCLTACFHSELRIMGELLLPRSVCGPSRYCFNVCPLPPPEGPCLMSVDIWLRQEAGVPEHVQIKGSGQSAKRALCVLRRDNLIELLKSQIFHGWVFLLTELGRVSVSECVT